MAKPFAVRQPHYGVKTGSLKKLNLVLLFLWLILPSYANLRTSNAAFAINLSPTTTPTIKPIAGEILIRFEPSIALTLYHELATLHNVDYPLLIGARLPIEQLNQAIPELNSLFSRFEVWAADAIDPQTGLWRLKLGSTTNPEQIAAIISDNKAVQYAEANYPIQAFAREPNDRFFSRNQTALKRIRVPEAWDISTGSEFVTIAILDTGLAYGHSELAGKIVTERSRNFVAEPANEFAWDDNGHGTYVAGIAAAQTNNNEGIAGVAWNAKLLSIKVLDYDYSGSIATLAMGLAYATTQPVEIVNMSNGGPIRSKVLEDTVKKAFAKGLVLVAASGNGGIQEYNYPASFDEVIAVGASDESDAPASFSSYGPYLSIVAPGVDVLSLSWASEREYATTKGTSASAPFVAGTIALMLDVRPNLTNRQIRKILEHTADKMSPPSPIPTLVPITIEPNGAIRASSLEASSSYSERIGWGRLNAFAAVQAAQKGELFSERYANFVATITGLPDPLEATATLTPGDTRFSDRNGQFEFANLTSGFHRLKIESKKYGLQVFHDFVISSTEQLTFVYDFKAALARKQATGEPLGAFAPVKHVNKQIQYFPQTAHTLSSGFQAFWERAGGVPIFGYPISEEFQENGRTVQYFERAVLEYWSEYALTGFEIKVRALGTLLSKNRSEKAFQPIKPFADTPTTRYIKESNHSIGGVFRTFWEANGEAKMLGYPISEPFEMLDLTGKPRLVQYFQNCRMDYFPELRETPYVIQLGLLASQFAKTEGWLGN